MSASTAPGAPSRRSRESAAAGGLAARDDHRGQRGTGRGFEGLLPSVVDVHQIEQGPDHAVDPGQQLGRRPASRLVERALEGIRPGDRTSVVLLGLTQGLLGALRDASTADR